MGHRHRDRRRHRHGNAWWSDLPRNISDLEEHAGDELMAPEPPRPRRRPRRRRSRQMTAEERAYLEARRAANAKIGFLFHFIMYAATCLLLLVLTGFRVFMIVAMSWGIAVVAHYFLIIAPQLRKRWVDNEVERQLNQSVTQERRVMQTQHNRNLEELTASIAHEIRNPITAAKSLVQQMGEDPRANENIEYAKVALDELDRVERSVSHLLRFAREEDVKLDEMSMADVVEAALDTFQDRVDKLGVQVHKEIDAQGSMRGDAEKLRRAIINLLGNSLDALAESETRNPKLEIQTGENLAGNQVWVRVRDNGPGMDAEKIQKIFKPFFTSKPQGTGLGLAITKKLVDAHGGSIEASSRPGDGAEFVMTFPKQASESQA